MRGERGELDADHAMSYLLSALALARVDPEDRGTSLTRAELLASAWDSAAPLDLGWRAYLEADLSTERLSTGRVQENIDHLERVTDTYREALPATWIHTRLYLADSYRFDGQFALAFATLEDARLDLAEQEFNEATRTVLAFDLAASEGSAYLDLGVLDQADKCFARCRELAQSPHLQLENRVESYIQRARFLMATSRFEELCEELEAPLADPEFEHFHGSFLAKQGKALSILEELERAPPGRAEPKLRQALQSRLDAGDRLWTSLELAELLLRSGDGEREAEGASVLESASDLFERAFVGGNVALEARVQTLRARRALILGASRAELEDQLGALRTAYQSQLAEWGAVPERRAGLGYLRYEVRQQVLTELAALLLELRGPEAGATDLVGHLMEAQSRGAVAGSLEHRSSAFADLARGDDALARIQAALLSAEHGALVYVPGTRDRSFVIAIDSDSAEILPLSPRWTWDPSTNELESLLSRRHQVPGAASDYDSLVAPLAAALLPPAVQARLAHWSGVTIVGRDLVGPVPFELLPLTGRRALGLELAVDYLPSLFLGCILAERHPAPKAWDTPGMRLTVLAAPEELAPAEFASLPWHDDRAGPWRAAYGRSSVLVYAGDSARPSVLRSAETARSDVLQLIVHGDYDGTWERPAGLVLTPDETSPRGRVWASDLERLRVPPLVVLSVCGAARGPERIGDDGAGDLSGALFRAGASSVLFSEYDLEYTPTLLLADVFHRRIARGDSPARAMLAARRSLADEPAYADPVHWAVVSVVGLGHAPLFEAREASPRYELVWAALALALLVVVLVRRRRAT